MEAPPAEEALTADAAATDTAATDAKMSPLVLDEVTGTMPNLILKSGVAAGHLPFELHLENQAQGTSTSLLDGALGTMPMPTAPPQEPAAPRARWLTVVRRTRPQLGSLAAPPLRRSRFWQRRRLPQHGWTPRR